MLEGRNPINAYQIIQRQQYQSVFTSGPYSEECALLKILTLEIIDKSNHYEMTLKTLSYVKYNSGIENKFLRSIIRFKYQKILALTFFDNILAYSVLFYVIYNKVYVQCMCGIYREKWLSILFLRTLYLQALNYTSGFKGFWDNNERREAQNNNRCSVCMVVLVNIHLHSSLDKGSLI